MNSFEESENKYLEYRLEEEKKVLSENEKKIYDFIDFCSKKDIHLTIDDISYVEKIGIVATHDNILLSLFPDIEFDKDGLFDLKTLSSHFKIHPLAAGYLYEERAILMAHFYFRRSYNILNNFCPNFLEHFWGLIKSDIKTYIALDENHLRINVDNSICREYDTWYGSLFNKEISEIKDNITKLRPPLDLEQSHISFLFANIYCLDIKWTTKDHIKTFYAEEFKHEDVTVQVDEQKVYPARYIHAEFDMQKQSFRHFDGSIHFYTSDEYYQRRDSDFNYNSKNKFQIKSSSKKLFRLDGVIDLDTWVKLVSLFFSQNPLVFEYFNGAYPPHIIEKLNIIYKSRSKD